MTNILRSHLVAAHIWGNVANYQDPDPNQYGWIISRSTAHLVADLANKEDELGTLMAAVTVTVNPQQTNAVLYTIYANVAR